MNPTDELLKTLDPAGRDVDPHGPRARDDLQRILATNAAADDSTPPGVVAADTFRARRRRRTGTRIALAAGLVAATAAAAVVLPSMVGRDQAFATWTATPGGLSAADRAKAGEHCRDDMKPGSPEYRKALSSAGVAIAERRGQWTLVVLAGRDGFSSLCLSDKPRSLLSGTMTGSLGYTAARDLPGPRKLTTTNFGTAILNNKPVSLVSGFAGTEVKAMTYTSASRGKVSATVADGHFALWLPGDEFENDLGQGERKGIPLRVTYRDGTQATFHVSL